MPFETLQKRQYATLFSTAGIGENDRQRLTAINENVAKFRRGLQTLSDDYATIYKDHFKGKDSKSLREPVHGLYWKYLEAQGLRDVSSSPDHIWFCTIDLYNPGTADGAGAKRLILTLVNWYGGKSADGLRHYTPDGGKVLHVVFTPDHYKTFELVTHHTYTQYGLGVYASASPLAFPG